jgi:transcriptional regulator with XRE-family HTH domain
MANNNIRTIGEKVKYFRSRTGINQMDLELAIEASSGTISRMEQDLVNPTKETLLKISAKLKLSPLEEAYLLGTILIQPTNDEINDAIAQFQKLLDREDVFGYVLDQYSCIRALSKGFIGLAMANGLDWKKLIGRNVAEIILDPNLGLRKVLDESKLGGMVSRVLAVMKVEREFMLDEGYYAELMFRLRQLPDFYKYWDAISSTKYDIYDIENRRIYFNFGGKMVEGTYHITVLHPDPRFSFLEYILKN